MMRMHILQKQNKDQDEGIFNTFKYDNIGIEAKYS